MNGFVRQADGGVLVFVNLHEGIRRKIMR